MVKPRIVDMCTKVPVKVCLNLFQVQVVVVVVVSFKPIQVRELGGVCGGGGGGGSL